MLGHESINSNKIKIVMYHFVIDIVPYFFFFLKIFKNLLLKGHCGISLFSQYFPSKRNYRARNKSFLKGLPMDTVPTYFQHVKSAIFMFNIFSATFFLHNDMSVTFVCL